MKYLILFQLKFKLANLFSFNFLLPIIKSCYWSEAFRSYFVIVSAVLVDDFEEDVYTSNYTKWPL